MDLIVNEATDRLFDCSFLQHLLSMYHVVSSAGHLQRPPNQAKEAKKKPYSHACSERTHSPDPNRLYFQKELSFQSLLQVLKNSAFRISWPQNPE